MNKKTFFCISLVFVLSVFCSSFLFAQENDANSEPMINYSLEIADKISTFSLKGKIFFMFTDTYANVIEVVPVRSDICRVVISVPAAKATSANALSSNDDMQNYNVYLRKNDLVLFQRGNKTYGGYVKDFDYNVVRFSGKVSE